MDQVILTFVVWTVIILVSGVFLEGLGNFLFEEIIEPYQLWRAEVKARRERIKAEREWQAYRTK
jgi:hypothetical protein